LAFPIFVPHPEKIIQGVAARTTLNCKVIRKPTTNHQQRRQT
jgi:hypothetical protein